jgi:ketosteroid isomerase-like protein
MKSMLLTGLTVILIAGGQTAPQGQADKAVQDAAAARAKAMNAGDAEGWGKYTTDDFIVIQADGTIKTKAQRMAEIKASPIGAPSEPTEQKWRTYGSDTAVSTALATIDGKPTRVTSVWVKQAGAWKVASVQLTTVSQAK